jgi:integrase
LQQAVDDELIATNPASRLGKFLNEKSADPVGKAKNPFTSAEIWQYLSAAREHYPQFYPLFLLLARTGLREGEALALRWDDLQFGTDDTDMHRFIRVERTYDPTTRDMTTPKNGKSRLVDMSRELRQVLLDWRDTCLDNAMIQGRTEPGPCVFSVEGNKPLSRSYVYALHRRICGLAGLRATRVHDLRHSFATIHLFEFHSPIQYVSAQLGHSSIGITISTYGHPQPGMNVSLADQLDEKTNQSAPYAHHGSEKGIL